MSARGSVRIRIAAGALAGGVIAVGAGVATARLAPIDDEGAVVASVLVAPLAALLGAGWVASAGSARDLVLRSGLGLILGALLGAALWIPR